MGKPQKNTLAYLNVLSESTDKKFDIKSFAPLKAHSPKDYFNL
jgi:hypothetical protein